MAPPRRFAPPPGAALADRQSRIRCALEVRLGALRLAGSWATPSPRGASGTRMITELPVIRLSDTPEQATAALQGTADLAPPVRQCRPLGGGAQRLGGGYSCFSGSSRVSSWGKIFGVAATTLPVVIQFCSPSKSLTRPPASSTSRLAAARSHCFRPMP